MIDWGIIITGAVGIISNFATWFLARKKYNAEVDHNLIDNMKESLEFYKTLSTDNKERLEEMIKRNEQLEEEVSELRKQMITLMSSICTDLSCQIRKRDISLFK